MDFYTESLRNVELVQALKV